MFIHTLKEWPHFKWDKEVFSTKLTHIRYLEGYLLGRMSNIGIDLRREASLDVLTSDVIKTSAIEGESLDYDSVRSSLAERLGITIENAPLRYRNVEGTVDLVLNATQYYQDSLTEERLFGWHSLLFPTGRSGLRQITVGALRTSASGDMQVISGPIGREIIHFIAPKAERLPHEMSLFLNWFNGESSLDPILKAGIAHFWFVTIHPFEDGNGRIARALTDLLLARTEQSADRFYSMSFWIEKERKAYYEALERSQRGGLDITEWLLWFLECLKNAIEGADTLLERILYKNSVWKDANQYPLNPRQKKLLNLMIEGFEGKLTTGKYAKIAKCSHDTALRDIQALLDYRIFTKNAEGGRSTNYTMRQRGNEKNDG